VRFHTSPDRARNWRHARVHSSIDDMGWSLRRIRRIRLRGDLERHSRNKSNPYAIEHFKDACVASVFLPKRRFVTRDGVTFEMEARGLAFMTSIWVLARRFCQLITAGAAVEEVIDIGGHDYEIKRREDTRFALIFLAERGLVFRDGVTLEIETPGLALRSAGVTSVGGGPTARVAEDECFDVGWHVDHFNCFLSLPRARQTNRGKNK
jgi:hypothetical protein